MKKTSKIAYIGLALLIEGCASFSASPRACEESLDSFMPEWLQIGTENIFQFGDCAMSKKLRIETGDYYRKNKKRIMEELDGKWNNLTYVGYLGELFGCGASDAPQFKDFLLKNRIQIFGSDDASIAPRKVMLNIGNFIVLDRDLANKCK